MAKRLPSSRRQEQVYFYDPLEGTETLHLYELSSKLHKRDIRLPLSQKLGCVCNGAYSSSFTNIFCFIYCKLAIPLSVEGAAPCYLDGNGWVQDQPLREPMTPHHMILERGAQSNWAKKARRLENDKKSGYCRLFWSLSAGCLSLVLAHRQVISLGQELPHFRFKRLVAGVEHAHPVHPAIYRVRHQLIQGGEVVVARVLAADRRAVSVGRERGRGEERAKRLLADTDVQSKDRRAVEIGELDIDIARHNRHKRKPMIRR